MIELKNISKSYELPKHTIEVLKGIDLTVDKGDFVAVMGPSGSGKSTLLNVIGCLDRPTAGQYLLEGVDVSQKSDDELAIVRNSKVGFVFQSFNLLPRVPAWKNVELPLLYSGMPYAERKAASMEVLGRLKLLHREDHQPSELSGGEQQRVAIARALVNNPIVILADEPTGNLDSRSGEEVIRIFEELNAGGVTIIIVTHEATVGERAQRVVTIKDGVCQNGCY